MVPLLGLSSENTARAKGELCAMDMDKDNVLKEEIIVTIDSLILTVSFDLYQIEIVIRRSI